MTFRGAVKAPNPTSTVIANLPATFQPNPDSAIFMKIVLNGGQGGLLTYDYLCHCLVLTQDGLVGAVGSAAKAFASLDGASFDTAIGTHIDAPGWVGYTGFRDGTVSWPAANVKLVNGFVRFQGLITKEDPEDPGTVLFTIPTQFRPGIAVRVYTNVGGIGSVAASWSYLDINPSGLVTTPGINPAVSNNAISLEGVSFSRTLSGNMQLPLMNGWVNHSSRQARVGKYGEVVRFQGDISGGTSTTIGFLPVGMRPTKTVKLPTITQETTAVLTINPDGKMIIDSQGGLTIATLHTTLDGVSFGL